MYTFSVGTDKLGNEFKKYDYHVSEDDEIIGVIFGHFAPFTGANGHGRMLKALADIGAQRFLVVTPDTRDKLDDNRLMYTTEQRRKICQKALKILGYEGIAATVMSRGGEALFNKIGRMACDAFGTNIRPVFCFGPDREDLANILAKFEDPSNIDRLEFIIDYERGTSGTRIRQYIKDGNLEAAAQETGYPIDFIQELSDLWQKNKKVLESPQDSGFEGKHSINHLWNNGKTTQMGVTEFKQLLDYLDTKANGIISKEKFIINEKIDGSSSFVGCDDEGLFFTKFGYTSKARSEDDLPAKYQAFFKVLSSCGIREKLESWRKKLNAEEVKVQLENVLPEASKTDKYVQIVLIPYLKEKIGKGLVVTIQALVDKKEVPESPVIMEDVQKCLCSTGINARGTVRLDFDPIDIKEDVKAAIEEIKRIETELGDSLENLTANRRSKSAREVLSLVSSYQKKLQDKILERFPNGQFGDYFEGLVVESVDGMIFKATSDKFKQLMERTERRYSGRHLSERIEGDKIIAWSSSKTPDLFKHYYDNDLFFGSTAGSAYGFAVYLVTEPPYTEDAGVGYSAATRAALYGENIFQFEIDQSKVMIFTYQEFLKTRLGQMTHASFQDFVRLQAERIGLELTDDEFAMIQPDPEAENDITVSTARSASNFYKIMSRRAYQGRRGNLRSVCDGLQYFGKNDGHTLVIWNNHRLVPMRYSNDNGKTWHDVDKDSPEYKEYLKKSALNDPNIRLDDRKKKIFDGNWTQEKENAYRLLRAFSSNDVTDGTAMSAGEFFNIVIHDDKTVDASFKSNLPMVDSYKHYYRIGKEGNEAMDTFRTDGFRFGTLDCGLKFGAENEKNRDQVYSLEDYIPEEYWPEKVTGGLKLVCETINHELMKRLLCEFGKNELTLTGCMIEEDVFGDWEVTLQSSKPTYCNDPDLYHDLSEKYDWMKYVIQGRPLTADEKTLKKMFQKIKTVKTDKTRQKQQVALDAFIDAHPEIDLELVKKKVDEEEQ